MSNAYDTFIAGWTRLWLRIANAIDGKGQTK